jgi:type IV secretion system protein VirB5
MSNNSDGRGISHARMTGVEGKADLESPYVSARREWNERYGSYIKRARTWQIVALASMALSGVLGLSLVKIASQAQVQPFIVEVDKLGEAIAVKPADTASIPDQRITRFQLAHFITNARSVTPDPTVQKRWLDGVYAISTSSAATFLNEHYKKNDPFQKGRTTLVSVEIGSAIPLSKNSWQVQWTETSRGLNGNIEGTTRWVAVLNIGVFPSTTPQQIIANPTGIVIEQINWTQQL